MINRWFARNLNLFKIDQTKIFLPETSNYLRWIELKYWLIFDSNIVGLHRKINKTKKRRKITNNGENEGAEIHMLIVCMFNLIQWTLKDGPSGDRNWTLDP